MSKRYRSFAEFYPFYLSQHQHPVCRRLHFIGSSLLLLLLGAALVTQTLWLLGLLPLVGYGFAWLGHFGFERNKPATFQYPLYSLLGDWLMFAQMLKGSLRR
ncbi:MAG: Mpo1-like protein [Shewanella sp.]